jgi:hypothetical protein
MRENFKLSNVSTGLIFSPVFLGLQQLLEGWNSLQPIGRFNSTHLDENTHLDFFFTISSSPKLNRQNEAENTTIVICEVTLSFGP